MNDNDSTPTMSGSQVSSEKLAAHLDAQRPQQQSEPRVWSRVQELANNEPTRPSVTFLGDRTYTRNDLCKLVERVAGGLGTLGVCPGDRVATMLGNRIEQVATWLACLRLGVVMVPLNVSMQGAILEHMLSKTAPVLLVVEADLLEQAHQALPAAPSCRTVVVCDLGDQVAVEGLPEHRLWDAVLRQAGPVAEALAGGMNPSSILFTSGTTGPSKGVIWSENTALALARGAQLVAGYREEDISYVTLPLFHANGLFISLLPALMVGAHTVVDVRFSVSRFWTQVRETGATVTSMLGIMAPLLTAQEPSAADRSHALTRVLCVPAPADRTRFEQRYGVPVRTFYALTDAGMPIGVTKGLDYPLGSCGQEMPDWQCELVDAEDRPVPCDTVGELVLRPRVAWSGSLGYWDDDRATIRTWQNLWFHTGDLMLRDAAGWFRFSDRTKDAIRRSGENVSSFEVERVLEEHPLVAEAAVFAVPSDLAEDEVMACVVLADQAEITARDLGVYCRPRLPYFAVPRFLEICQQLPKTPTQKVQKDLLRKRGRTSQTVDLGVTRRRPAGASRTSNGAVGA